MQALYLVAADHFLEIQLLPTFIVSFVGPCLL